MSNDDGTATPDPLDTVTEEELREVEQSTEGDVDLRAEAAPRLAAEVRALRADAEGRRAQLDMANAEIERLRAELAARPAPVDARICRVCREPADSHLESDGFEIHRGGVQICDGFEPIASAADASLEARESLRIAIEAMTTEEGEDPAEELFTNDRLRPDECEALIDTHRARVNALRAAFRAWRDVDASRPGLTEEQARTLCRSLWPDGWDGMGTFMRDQIVALVMRVSRAEVGADRPDASALAEVVAASAREPHADVVLQALHVSGGAAAVDAMRATLHDGDPAKAPVNSIGTCSRCGYHGPGPGHECKIPGIVCKVCDKYILRGQMYAGRTGDAAHRACLAAENAIGSHYKIAGEPGVYDYSGKLIEPRPT